MIAGTRQHTANSPARPEDLYLQSQGAQLRYRDAGRGPAVLLIHGWTLDLDMWEPQVAGLADDFRVVRFDRRGFGLSSGSPSLAADVADAITLCRHLKLQPVACVGMSQGARVALQLPVAEPALTSCLVLDGPPDYFAAQEPDDTDVALPEYRALLATGGIAAFRREWAKHPLTQLRTQDEGAHKLLGRMIGRYPGKDLGEPAAGARAYPEPRSLASLRKPALVISGEFDLEGRRRAADELARTLPLAEQALITAAGHLSNLDNPQMYNTALRNFLNRHVTARS